MTKKQLFATILYRGIQAVVIACILACLAYLGISVVDPFNDLLTNGDFSKRFVSFQYAVGCATLAIITIFVVPFLIYGLGAGLLWIYRWSDFHRYDNRRK